MDSHGLFADLCRRLVVRPDHRGEAHVACPWCGKEAKRGQTHFSFNERGGYCWVCGESGGLTKVARALGLIEGGGPARGARPTPPPPKRERPIPAAFGALAQAFACHPEAVARWQAYKPLSTGRIAAYRLGYGAYPAYMSKCPHPRLQVPLIVGGRVVGFRGRAVECDCGKWLSPGGSHTVLYNGARLGEGPGLAYALRGALCPEERGPLTIVENPIDALLAEQCLGDATVATLGVSLWRDEWTAALVRARPGRVLVWFDNDRPGNGGGVRGRKEWLKNHPCDIVPAGVRLVNRLLAAGLSARLYQWAPSAPLKADVGDVLAYAAGKGGEG